MSTAIQEVVVMSGSVTFTNKDGERSHAPEGAVLEMDERDAKHFLKRGVVMTRKAFEEKVAAEKAEEDAFLNKSESGTAAMLMAADIKFDKPEKAASKK